MKREREREREREEKKKQYNILLRTTIKEK